MFEGWLVGLEVLDVREVDGGAVFGQPLEEAAGVVDREIFWEVSDFGTEVEDEADAYFGAEVGCCEEFGGAEAGGVPLDCFCNGWA